MPGTTDHKRVPKPPTSRTALISHLLLDFPNAYAREPMLPARDVAPLKAPLILPCLRDICSLPARNPPTTDFNPA